MRKRVEKPSGSQGFVVMVLLFDGRELVFGSSLADQGILADSTCMCVWKEATVSVLIHVVKCFWGGEAMSHEQLLMWENVDDLTIPGGQNGVMSRLIVGSLLCCLRSLSFDNEFNQCLDRVIIPSCVRTIVFGDRFNQPLQHVSLPSDLHNFTFGRAV